VSAPSGGRAPAATRSHSPALAVVWGVLMAIWLGALLFGLWWVWPHFERGALTGDLVLAVLWLLGGGAAWVVALNAGRAWFRRR
jgi:hypothetical protein